MIFEHKPWVSYDSYEAVGGQKKIWIQHDYSTGQILIRISENGDDDSSIAIRLGNEGALEIARILLNFVIEED